MTTKQNLSILIFLKRNKIDSKGKIPIYFRVTIDGLREQMSSGYKILDQDWDPDTKQAHTTEPFHKEINKKLRQIETDLERHFDLIQAKEGLATPILVLESYKTPINGAQIQNEKVQNLAFSEALDKLVIQYCKFHDKKSKAYEFENTPSPEKRYLLDREETEIKKTLTQIIKQGNAIFDKKKHRKTFYPRRRRIHVKFPPTVYFR